MSSQEFIHNENEIERPETTINCFNVEFIRMPNVKSSEKDTLSCSSSLHNRCGTLHHYLGGRRARILVFEVEVFTLFAAHRMLIYRYPAMPLVLLLANN